MNREVARAAAQWLALLESGAATERDHAALQHWRDSHPQHEHTWQKAQALRQRFSALPQALAMASLDRPQVGRRALLKRALGVAALVPTAWLISRQLPIDSWRADLHTATGERRRLPLAEGGSLQLNTATAVDVDPAQRRITLVDGELALNVPGAHAMTLRTRYGEVRVSQAEVCVRQLAAGCRLPGVGAQGPRAGARRERATGDVAGRPASAIERRRARCAGAVRCVATGLARRRADRTEPGAGGFPA